MVPGPVGTRGRGRGRVKIVVPESDVKPFIMRSELRECLWRMGWYLDELSFVRQYPLTADRTRTELLCCEAVMRFAVLAYRHLAKDYPKARPKEALRRYFDRPANEYTNLNGLSALLDTILPEINSSALENDFDATIPALFPAPPRLSGPVFDLSRLPPPAERPRGLRGECIDSLTAETLRTAHLLAPGRLAIHRGSLAICRCLSGVDDDGTVRVAEVEDYGPPVDTDHSPYITGPATDFTPLLAPREGLFWDVPAGEIVVACWPFVTVMYPAQVVETACAANGYTYTLLCNLSGGTQHTADKERRVHAFWVAPCDRASLAIILRNQQIERDMALGLIMPELPLQ